MSKFLTCNLTCKNSGLHVFRRTYAVPNTHEVVGRT